MPDLRFIMSPNVNKRGEREGRMVTLAPSVKYVYMKQCSLSPPRFTPAKLFKGNKLTSSFTLWAPLSFQKAWPCLGCLKYFKHLVKGWIHHRRLKLTSREKANDKFMKRHALCDSVISYKRNRWKLIHVIRSCTRNEIWSIYNDKYFEIENILGVKSLKLTHILCVRCSFWWFLPL